MKKEDLTLKNILAIFVVFFGMFAVVYVKMPDLVLGALLGNISAVLMYFFGSSTGSTAKDKVIQNLNTQSIIGGSTPPPDKDEK